jgi:hypothetical protein
LVASASRLVRLGSQLSLPKPTYQDREVVGHLHFHHVIGAKQCTDFVSGLGVQTRSYIGYPLHDGQRTAILSVA